MNHDYIKGYHVWFAPKYEALRNGRLNMMGRPEFSPPATLYRIQSPTGRVFVSAVSFASPVFKERLNKYATTAEYLGKVIS